MQKRFAYLRPFTLILLTCLCAHTTSTLSSTIIEALKKKIKGCSTLKHLNIYGRANDTSWQDLSFSTQKSDLEQAKVKLVNARFFTKKGQYKSAIMIYEELIKMFKGEKEEKYQAFLLEAYNGLVEVVKKCNSEAIEHRKKGRYEEAEASHFTAFQACSKHPYAQKSAADALLSIGLIHQNSKAYDEAIEQIRGAIVYYEKNNLLGGVACAEVNIANCYVAKRNKEIDGLKEKNKETPNRIKRFHEKAIEYFNRSVQNYEKIGNHEQDIIVVCYQRMMAHMTVKQYKVVNSMAQCTFDNYVDKLIKDTETSPETSSSLLDRAKDSFKISVKITYILDSIGDLCDEIGKPILGKKYHLAAVCLSDKATNDYLDKERIHGLAKFFTQKGDLSSAMICYEKYIELCDETGKPTLGKKYHLAAVCLSDEATNDYLDKERIHGLAKFFEQKGDLSSAMICYEKYIELCDENTLDLGHLHNDMGNCYIKLSRKEQAEDHYNIALVIYTDHKDPFFLAEINLNLGLFYYDHTTYRQSAINNITTAIQYYSKVKGKETIVKEKKSKAYAKLGKAYQVIGKYKESIRAFEIAMPYYKEINDTCTQACIAYNIAFSYQKEEKHLEATKHYRKARELFVAVKKVLRVAQCDRLLGDLCALQGKKDKALDYYNAANKVQEKASASVEKSAILQGMARISKSSGDDKKAIELFQRAIPVLNPKSLAYALAKSDVGVCYLREKMPKKAIQCHKTALAIRIRKKAKNNLIALNHAIIGMALLQLACIEEVDYEDEKYKEAITHTKKAIEILDQDQNKEKYLYNWLNYMDNLAFIYQKQDKIEEAKEQHRKILQFCENSFLPNDSFAANSYDKAAQFYYDCKDFQKAYILWKRALDIRLKQSQKLDIEALKNYIKLGDIVFLLDDKIQKELTYTILPEEKENIDTSNTQTTSDILTMSYYKEGLKAIDKVDFKSEEELIEGKKCCEKVKEFFVKKKKHSL